MANYLTTEEVGQALRTPTETVRYWRHVGKGPASFKIGRRVLYDEADVQAWIESERAAQAGDAACSGAAS
jgi:excisionase family DNA binding protein